MFLYPHYSCLLDNSLLYLHWLSSIHNWIHINFWFMCMQ